MCCPCTKLNQSDKRTDTLLYEKILHEPVCVFVCVHPQKNMQLSAQLTFKSWKSNAVSQNKKKSVHITHGSQLQERIKEQIKTKQQLAEK